jgi:AhpD family alkylhydroperoxidase
MSVSYVERDQASAETIEFYDKAEDRFEMLLNIFKVFGHTPELGTVFTDLVMAILKDGELDWVTKELIILKATHRNDCQYCVVQHETLSKRLGISEEKIADIGDDRYKASPHFTDAEKALLDLTVQIGVDANRLSKDLWDRLHANFTEPQIVEAVFTITIYIAVSKFGDALGVELEPVFSGIEPLLEVTHHQAAE